MPTDFHAEVSPSTDARLLALAAQLVAKIAAMQRAATPTAARKEDGRGRGEAASA